MTTTVKCPTCRRPVEWSEASVYRPFCSDRCRLVDLGAWFSNERSIPDESPVSDESAVPDEGAPDDRSKDA